MCHNAPPRAENAFLWLRFGEGRQATACIEDLAIWHGLAVECLASPPLAIAGCWLVPRTPRTGVAMVEQSTCIRLCLFDLFVPVHASHWHFCCDVMALLGWRPKHSTEIQRMKDRRRQLITKTHQAATTLPKKDRFPDIGLTCSPISPWVQLYPIPALLYLHCAQW